MFFCEFEASAGTPGIFQQYFVETQRAALRRGTDSAEITIEDFAAARDSERYKELLRIAFSIHANTGDYDDIPLRPKVSGSSAKGAHPPKDPAGTLQPIATQPMKDVVAGLLRNYKAAQTREANLLTKRIEAMQSYTDDDLRMLGVSHDLVEEAKKLGGATLVQNKRKKKGGPA